MTTQIEARRLSGADRGKHVSLQVEGGRHTGPWQLEGELKAITHFGNGSITLVVTRDDGPAMGTGIHPDTSVMITGQPAPAPVWADLGPDCRDGKHRACDARAYNLDTDQIVLCPCICHV